MVPCLHGALPQEIGLQMVGTQTTEVQRDPGILGIIGHTSLDLQCHTEMKILMMREGV